MPAHPQGDPVGEVIADHAGLDQPIAARFCADTLGNLDELFRSGVAAIRFPSAQVPDGGHGRGADEDEEDEDRESFHVIGQVWRPAVGRSEDLRYIFYSLYRSYWASA